MSKGQSSDESSYYNSALKHQQMYANQYPRPYAFAGAIGAGWGMMLATTPIISPLNYASVLAANGNLSSVESLRAMSSNPLKGVEKHLAKEFPRAIAKSLSVRESKPLIKEKFPNNPLIAAIIFAVTTSIATEVPVNPLEVWKVQKQSGLPFKNPMKGVGLSVARQTPIWLLFDYFYGKINEFLENRGQNPFDPRLLPVKAVPIAASFSPLTHVVFGRTRLEMQTGICAAQPDKIPVGGFTGTLDKAVTTVIKKIPDRAAVAPFKKSAMHVVRAQGARGLTRGLGLKMASDAALVGGVLIVVECTKWGLPPATKANGSWVKSIGSSDKSREV